MSEKNDNFYNVAIFIDYENVHKTLLNMYKNALREGFFEKLKVWCKTHNRRIVKIAVYCNFDIKDLYESHHQSFLQSYGVETIHTSNQGKNYADLKLAIDVLNSMYTNDNIDEFIIMSNDKDMTPLLNTVRLNKRKASVLTTGKKFNSTLCEFADEQIKFEDIINIDFSGELLVNSIEKKFISDIRKYVENGLAEFKKLTYENKTYKKHYNIDFFVTQQSDYYNVMKYEILNIIQKFYSENKIIFYKHMFKGNDTLAIIPSEYKDNFISLGIINENQIFEKYDINTMVKQKYEEYCQKSKDNS